jgi:hypothetical protein
MREQVSMGFSIGAEQFSCVPVLPVGILADLTTGGSRGLPWVLEFLQAVIVDADAERFNVMLHDKDIIVDGEVLTEVVNWLLAEYTGRPTSPSTSSRSGRSKIGNGSKSGASRKASSRSTSAADGS